MFTLKSNAFKNTFKNDHDLKRPKEDPKYNGSTKKILHWLFAQWEKSK